MANAACKQEAIQPFQLQGFFPYLTRVFYKDVSTALTRIYADQYGMAPSEWRTMAILGLDESYTAVEIVELSSMDKVTVSRAVKKMLEAGMLDRCINKNDARSSVLSLSGKGRKIYLDLVPQLLAFEKQLLKGISRKEHDLLLSLMKKVQKNASDL